MAKFFVDDCNADTTGPYETIEEALEDANENLSHYRSNALFDGWDLGEGDLCIYEVPDDFAENDEDSDPRDGKLVAKVMEVDKEPVEEGCSDFEYTCDMRMEIVQP